MSSPDIMIVFWGNPLYDGRCVNMINQFRDEKLTVKIIGVGKDNETFDFNNSNIISEIMCHVNKLRNIH